jgi:hypothetical protein
VEWTKVFGVERQLGPSQLALLGPDERAEVGLWPEVCASGRKEGSKEVICLEELIEKEPDLEEWDESDFQVLVREEELKITKGINRKSKLKAVEEVIYEGSRKKRGGNWGERLAGGVSDPGRKYEDRGVAGKETEEMRKLQDSVADAGTGGYLTRAKKAWLLAKVAGMGFGGGDRAAIIGMAEVMEENKV